VKSEDVDELLVDGKSKKISHLVTCISTLLHHENKKKDRKQEQQQRLTTTTTTTETE